MKNTRGLTVILSSSAVSYNLLSLLQQSDGAAITALNTAGLGYAQNDTGFIVGGDGLAAYKVLTVGGGGAVATYAITAYGSGYSLGTNIATIIGGVQPGLGDGAFTIDITKLSKGDAGFTDPTWRKAMRVIIQSDLINNTAVLFRGNSDVANSGTTPTRAGFVSTKGIIDDQMKSHHNEFDLGAIYLKGSAAGVIANVTVAWR